MGLFTRFEEIRAWQEARVLTRQMYVLGDSEKYRHDFGLRDQIRRAAVSAMTNIAEGFDCESPKEFARFLEIARRSAVEVQSLLYVAPDANYITQETFQTHFKQAQSVQKLIGGLRHAVLKRLQTP